MPSDLNCCGDSPKYPFMSEASIIQAIVLECEAVGGRCGGVFIRTAVVVEYYEAHNILIELFLGVDRCLPKLMTAACGIDVVGK